MRRPTIKSRVRDAMSCLSHLADARVGVPITPRDVSAIAGTGRWLEEALDTPDTQERVREFHESFGLMVRDTPQDIPPDEVAFRLTLLAEEVAELVGAMCGMTHDGAKELGEHLVKLFTGYPMVEAFVDEVARESSDILAVIYGIALHYGYDQDAAAGEVLAACMRKLGPDGKPIKRADGKVMKPEGWEPPNVAAAIGLDRPEREAA